MKRTMKGMFFIFVIQIIGLMADQLFKRELLDTEKDLFQDVRDRLTKLENMIDSRECNDKLTQGDSRSYSPGTMYIRWGRSSCGTNGSSLVYAGITGGSHFTHSGGAAEYLCLPLKPDLGLHQKENQLGGYLYGAEYELSDNSFLHQSFSDHEVPCAACEVTGRIKYLMIPGKQHCPKTWIKEYSGYLMSGKHDHASATEYICVDNNGKKLDIQQTTMAVFYTWWRPYVDHCHARHMRMNAKSLVLSVLNKNAINQTLVFVFFYILTN